MLFENRKNKIVFGPKILKRTYQKWSFWFRVFSIKFHAFLQMHFWEFKYPRRHFALGSISFSMKINDFWWFLMFFACFLNHCKTGVLIFWRSISTKKHRFSRVFLVLFDPLQNRRVDFLTLNLDLKSCYFRVFFACFLIHCKTGVLIFWRSISTKNRVIFVCFSRASWSIAKAACWFFRVTRSVGF